MTADHGAITDNGDGTFTLVPEPDYNGLVTLNYTVADTIDGSGGNLAATNSLTLAAVNDSASVGAGSDIVGNVIEDAVPNTAGGTVFFNDPDANESHAEVATEVATALGKYSVDEDGNWVFTLDNTNTVVQALGAGVTTTDTFTINSKDGSASQQITITITGTNDVPEILGTFIGNATEDVQSAVSNTIIFNDDDTGETGTTPDAGNTTYGTYTVDAAGVWVYMLDSTNPAVQALGSGVTTTDTFTVTSADGSASQQVTITITGENDAASVSGTLTKNIGEDDTVGVGGTATVTDTDTDEDKFQTPATLAGAHGTFTFNANSGAWTYKVDNAQPAVQALKAGDILTDSLTVTSFDGSVSQNIVVTIDGADEAPHPVDPDTETPVNTNTDGVQSGVATAALPLPNGGWVSVWITPDSDGSGIVFQVFDADGNPVGTETAVNSITGLNQFEPSIAVLADGGWVISWTSEDSDAADGWGIFQRRFDGNGTPVDAADVVVKANLTEYQYDSTVTALPDHGWLVTWNADTADGGASVVTGAL